jgi:hypothetical protein
MYRSSNYNLYTCPNCEEDVPVALPAAKWATCPECCTKLEIHPDADWEDGMWHDRTTLSVVDPEREHMKAMVRHAERMEQECDHRYAERETAPLGVKCVKCGHFVGAHE